MALPYVAASMGGGVKRVIQPVAGPAMKRQAVGGEGEGGWNCAKCGNHNYEGRFYCNLRKCGAPGPWTCPACGNKNYANRDICNKRTCNQPRPPPGAAGLAAGRGPVAAAPGQQQAVMQALSLLQAAGVANIPGVQDGISKIVASTAVRGPAGGFAPAVQTKQGAVMEGSWVCLGCGNINFPTRTSCNARSCGRPREEVDGGPAKPGASSKSIFMPGSWVCAACENINWPKRETCGMQKCGRPRAEVDAGPPTPQHQQRLEGQQATIAMQVPGARPAPEGSWHCDACGNLNYPNREACNARNCGKPRQ